MSEIQKTPLNAWHAANGAKMVDFAGWHMPVQYSNGILQEHLACRKFGGMFDVSHMGRFRIKGRDRIKFLQHVLTNNAQALDLWQAQYTLIAAEDGGVIDDAYLYRFGEDDYLLVVNASNKEKDWKHFQAQTSGFKDVALEDHSDSTAMIAFQGPLAGRILEELAGAAALPQPLRNSLSSVNIRGIKALVARTGYTGEPEGFEFFVESGKAEALWTILHDTGKARGVVPVGLGARDTLRLEAGLPLYGHEFGIDPEGAVFPAFAYPLTDIAVSFSPLKGEYIGRGALARQFEQVQKMRDGTYEPSQALRRRTVPVAVAEGGGAARQGDQVFIGEKKVGFVTSGSVTPYWKFEGEGASSHITDQSERRTIALACLDAELLPGQELEIALKKRRQPARIARWHGRSEAPPYFRPIPIQLAAGPAAPSRMVGEGIAKAELLLKKSLENHAWRQQRCVNLIPSEMTPSPLVRLLQVSDPVGRYAEHKELLADFEREVFYYQGVDFIAWVEERLTAEMVAFLGCRQVESRLVSGQMANIAVFSAFVDYKNRIDRRREPERMRLVMNNHIGRGGHLSSQPMGALRDYVAKDPVTERFAVVNFPVMPDNPYKADIAQITALLDRYDPEFVIFGKSMILHREPVAEVKRLLKSKKTQPMIMYDMAHVLGLIGPHFQEPFKDGADLVTGSTHKTFFGTQRGVIGTAFEPDTAEFEMWKAIRRRAFPGMVSNHHLGTLLGLLMAAIEMNTFKDEYQAKVVSNAKAFAKALKHAGLAVEGDPAIDYTETHQVLVNVGYGRGCETARRLEQNNIVVNYQALPRDDGFTASSGLRMGVSEMTRFGMNEGDFKDLASLVADVINGKEAGESVARFRQKFQAMRYCFDTAALDPLKAKLLATF